MNRLMFMMYSLFEHRLQPRFDARLQFLEAQIRFLRARLDTSRIVPTPEEKLELLRLGEILGHEVDNVIHIVRPQTYKNWLRKQRRSERFRPSGRSRMSDALRNLILRIRQDNTWGYRRICGELRKLGYRIGPTTVRKVLCEAGFTPPPHAPSRPQPIPWTTFVHANIDAIVACDFFTKKIVTLRGTMTAYVLVYIHLGSRRVWHSAATYHPNGEWVMQQNRNAAMWMEDEGIQARFLLSDRDRKFPEKMKEFWLSEGVRTLRSPVQAPKANAFCEAFIGTLKRECLNHFVCFSPEQLDYINRTWVKYYNTLRPHRGIGMENNVLDVKFRPRATGRIRCQKQLGGLIKSYYRDAA